MEAGMPSFVGFFFLQHWGLNSGFELAWQVFYHLNPSTTLLWGLGIFETGSFRLFAWADNPDCCLPDTGDLQV
jgi:hypothetical protein